MPLVKKASMLSMDQKKKIKEILIMEETWSRLRCRAHRHQARIRYGMEIKIYLNLEKSVFVFTPPRINIRGKQSRWVSHFMLSTGIYLMERLQGSLFL